MSSELSDIDVAMGGTDETHTPQGDRPPAGPSDSTSASSTTSHRARFSSVVIDAGPYVTTALIHDLQRFRREIINDKASAQDVTDFIHCIQDESFWELAAQVFPSIRGELDALVDRTDGSNTVLDDEPGEATVSQRMREAASSFIPVEGGLLSDHAEVLLVKRLITILTSLVIETQEGVNKVVRVKVAQCLAPLHDLLGWSVAPELRHLAKETFGEQVQHPSARDEGDNFNNNTGLKNGGNTCFQNITFWLLVFSDRVMQKIGNPMDPSSDLEPELVPVRDTLVELLRCLWAGLKDGAIAQLAEFWSLQTFADKGSALCLFKRGRQQDPSEFFHRVLEPTLGEHIRPSLELDYEIEYRCTSCHRRTVVKDEPRLMLPLAIPQPAPSKADLRLLLSDELTRVEDGVMKECPHCGQVNVEHGKQERMKPATDGNLPDIAVQCLLFQTGLVDGKFKVTKLRTHVEFPESVIAVPGLNALYCVKYIGCHEGRSPNSGHYYCYGRGPLQALKKLQGGGTDAGLADNSGVETGEQAQDSFTSWTLYNDSRMKSGVPYATVQKEQMYLALLTPVTTNDIAALCQHTAAPLRDQVVAAFTEELQRNAALYSRADAQANAHPDSASRPVLELGKALMLILRGLTAEVAESGLQDKKATAELTVSDTTWSHLALRGEDAPSSSQQARDVDAIAHAVAAYTLNHYWSSAIAEWQAQADPKDSIDAASQAIYDSVFSSRTLAAIILHIITDHIRQQSVKRQRRAWTAWKSDHPRDSGPSSSLPSSDPPPPPPSPPNKDEAARKAEEARLLKEKEDALQKEKEARLLKEKEDALQKEKEARLQKEKDEATRKAEEARLQREKDEATRNAQLGEQNARDKSKSQEAQRQQSADEQAAAEKGAEDARVDEKIAKLGAKLEDAMHKQNEVHAADIRDIKAMLQQLLGQETRSKQHQEGVQQDPLHDTDQHSPDDQEEHSGSSSSSSKDSDDPDDGHSQPQHLGPGQVFGALPFRSSEIPSSPPRFAGGGKHPPQDLQQGDQTEPGDPFMEIDRPRTNLRTTPSVLSDDESSALDDTLQRSPTYTRSRIPRPSAHGLHYQLLARSRHHIGEQPAPNLSPIVENPATPGARGALGNKDGARERATDDSASTPTRTGPSDTAATKKLRNFSKPITDNVDAPAKASPRRPRSGGNGHSARPPPPTWLSGSGTRPEGVRDADPDRHDADLGRSEPRQQDYAPSQPMDQGALQPSSVPSIYFTPQEYARHQFQTAGAPFPAPAAPPVSLPTDPLASLTSLPLSGRRSSSRGRLSRTGARLANIGQRAIRGASRLQGRLRASVSHPALYHAAQEQSQYSSQPSGDPTRPPQSAQVPRPPLPSSQDLTSSDHPLPSSSHDTNMTSDNHLLDVAGYPRPSAQDSSASQGLRESRTNPATQGPGEEPFFRRFAAPRPIPPRSSSLTGNRDQSGSRSSQQGSMPQAGSETGRFHHRHVPSQQSTYSQLSTYSQQTGQSYGSGSSGPQGSRGRRRLQKKRK